MTFEQAEKIIELLDALGYLGSFGVAIVFCIMIVVMMDSLKRK